MIIGLANVRTEYLGFFARKWSFAKFAGAWCMFHFFERFVLLVI